MKEWVGLLDCNNFFVSCERLFRPDLTHKPVVVLSSNDGCVVARSKEIKDKGIPMGVPYFQIKDIIKDIDAVTFSSHFALYRDISRRVFEVMRTELDTVEQYSVDEAFFRIEGGEEAVLSLLTRLKDKVEREVGIPVSVAAAASKTQVKFANSVAKKTGGVYLMTQRAWQEKVSIIKLVDIWGVALASAKQFGGKGISTVADLLALERTAVQQHFGVHGVRLWLELQGKAAIGVSRQAESQKSIISSRSFAAASSDKEVIKDAVAYHVRQAAEDLRAMQKKTGFIQVSIMPSRHGDYLLQGGSQGVRLLETTSDTFVLLAEATAIVERIFRPGVPYKKAGILLTDFIPQTVRQDSLFPSLQSQKTETLMPIIDAINKTSSRELLQLGTRLKGEQWQSAREKRSPAYTTNWAALKTVKA